MYVDIYKNEGRTNANGKRTKIELLEKIHDDRVSFEQNIGWLFRPLALCPFPAKCLGKRTVKDVWGKEKEEYHIVWQRKSGNVTVEVLAHPKYGVPFGQDTLLILYLANEARIQKSRKIKVNFYRDFMRMFNMNPNDGRKYRLVINSLRRIRKSQYSWEIDGDANRDRGLHYLYIEEYDLYCDPKNPDQKPLFDQYILLSERFWHEICNHKIPYSINAAIYLKQKPAYLNFYLWVSTRIGMLNNQRKEKELEKIEAFIPYWGVNGLIEQLSTRIKRRPDFRSYLKKWVKAVHELWPRCPIKIEGDGLKFNISSDIQLDIQVDPQIETGKTIRKSIEKKKKNLLPCPICGKQMELRKGRKIKTTTLGDFYRCTHCEKNYPIKEIDNYRKRLEKQKATK